MILRPSGAFMLADPAHVIALGFGTGLSRFAPGTVGTLAAFPLHGVLSAWFAPHEIVAVIALLFGIGVWACARTGAALGLHDHPAMNWDEVVAFLLVLVFTPQGIAWSVFAFLAFRAFDVIKPPPIRHFDRTVKGGFGVMFDDLLAAFYTLLALALVRQAIDWGGLA